MSFGQQDPFGGFMHPDIKVSLSAGHQDSQIFNNASQEGFQLNLSEVDDMDILQVDEWVAVSNGETKGKDVDTGPKVEDVKGDADIVAKLFKKARAIETQEDDEKEFFKREKSIKPPLPGKISNVAFPGKPEDREELNFDPSDVDVEESAEKLNVTRCFPTGEVSYSCSRLKVAFDQPMVSVGTVSDVDAEFQKMGISIQPEAKGDWRWSGTKLCQFMSETRFRYSTEYTVTIPKGLKSALGGTLESVKTFTFRTPRLQCSSFTAYPHLDTKPIVCVTFNQDVKKDMLYKAMKVEGTDRKAIVLDPANAENEAALTEDQKRHLRNWWKMQGEIGRARSICFRFDKELKKATKHRFIVREGSVIGEGPRPCVKLYQDFHTYPPNTICSHHPKRSNSRYISCHPGTPLSISFSNALDRKSVKKEHFKVEPPVTGIRVIVQGSGVVIEHDDFEIGTAYQVTVSRALKDKWGQNLTGNNVVEFKKVTKQPETKYGSLNGVQSAKLTLNPFTEKPEYLVQVTNYEELQVTAYEVKMQDLCRNPYDVYKNKKLKKWPFPIIKQETLQVEVTLPASNRNKPQPFKIPVSKYLELQQKNGLGHVLLVVEPTRKAFKNNSDYQSTVDRMFRGDRYLRDRPVVCTWLERTFLGLDIIGSGRTSDQYCIAWVTDLRTGKPVSGVKLELLDYSLKHVVVPGATDGNGLLRIPMPGRFARLAAARLKDDCVYLPINGHFRDPSRKVWKVVNDRGLYKPGEEVSIKGYVRWLKLEKDALVPRYLKPQEISVTVWDPRGTKIASLSQKVKVNDYGAFSLKLDLPDNINTGSARVQFVDAGNGVHTHTFKIQEFRRPEYKVSASHRPGSDAPQFSNPLPADWAQLKASEEKAMESSVTNCLDTLAIITEKARQDKVANREEKLEAARASGEEELKKVEAEISDEEAQETKKLKSEEEKEEKRLRAEIAAARVSPNFKFKVGVEPCVIASVQADYFAGGGLSDAEVRWTAEVKMASFTPPKCIGFTFGKQRRWWWESGPSFAFDEVCEFLSAPSLEPGITSSGETITTARMKGKTDSNGTHEVAIRWSRLLEDKCSPLDITATANVMDLNNQMRSTSTSFLIHPCRYYVGFSLKKTTVEAGKPFEAEVIVVDPTGKRIPGIKVQATLNGERRIRMEDSQGLTVTKTLYALIVGSVTSLGGNDGEEEDAKEMEAASIKLTPNMGGTYTLTVKVYDEFGGWHESQSASLYVSDPSKPDPGAVAYDMLQMWSVPGEKLTIIPDKKEYETKDQALLTIRCPFSPAEGLLYVDCDGLAGSMMPFSVPEGKESVDMNLGINPQWVPGITVRAILAGARARETPTDPAENDQKAKEEKKDLRPAYATGEIKLQVSSRQYALNVTVEPAAKTDDVAPGKSIKTKVMVKDYAGNPVPNAEVCLIMVDEAVLSLSGHTIQSMLGVMYPDRYYTSSFSRSRSTLKLLPLSQRKIVEVQKEPEMLYDEDCECEAMDFCAAPMMAMQNSAMMSRGFGGASEERKEGAADFGLDNDDPISVRSNFNPLASFEPSVLTNAEGVVEVSVNLPDNLTSYRVWAIVTTERLYGLGENTLSVSLPLMVRPSPPRFLNFGDKCLVSVVLQNQTTKDLVALIAARGANADVDPQKCAAKVTLKPLQRGAMCFGVSAMKAGTARLQFVSSAKGAADAAELEFPVYTPATSEAFATYGSVDIDGQDSDMAPKKPGEDGKAVDLTQEENESADPADAKSMQLVVQPIKAPVDVWPQFGGLEISTSTTQLQHLTDAVIHLYEYEYECSEQLASRILGVLSVNDVLEAFKSDKLPDKKKLKAKLRTWLKTLYTRQARNGGFWTWGPPKYYNILQLPSPYVSVHVSCCLAMCEEKKIEVKPNVKRASLSYIKNIEKRLADFPLMRYWSPRYYNSIVSFALYARTRWGENVAAEAAKFYGKRGAANFTPEATAHVLTALSMDQLEHGKLIAKMKKSVEKHMTEEADTAYFTQSYDEVGRHIMLNSNRRTDAVMLEALIAVDGTKNILSPKLCKGLLKHKLKSGGWGSTQENCWVLVALVRYFHEFEKHVPDFKISLWYGALFGGKQDWKGRSTETKQALVPMRAVQALGDNNFMIHKEGKGRLYYRIGLSYAPKALRLSAANYGFNVSRTYASAGDDDKENVVFDAKEQAWRVKLGERVKVTVTMITTAKRFHVALVDFLPAGLEPLNPALKGSPKGDENDSASGGDPFRPCSWGHYNPYTFRCYSRHYWPEHINLRDERAEAFRSLLWPGIYEFTYTARATTEGTFVVPPAKAEEMYSPEIFGRSASEKFAVVKA